jgi:deoxyribodipyrimidine photolyase-related protein
MLGIVFPHQCFADIPESWKEVWFVRHDIGYGGKQTTVRDFHIARKIFLRAAEKGWIAMAESKGLKVTLKKGTTWATKESVEVWDPVDHMLLAEIQKQCPKATVLPTPAFLLTSQEALTMLGNGAHDSHQAFYGKMRQTFQILMKGSKPEGGKLRFDTENRQALTSDVDIPDWDKELNARQSRWVSEAAKEIQVEGGGLGTWTGTLAFPTTHEGAKMALKRFCQQRLKEFGPFQDAISAEEGDFLFHSVLSAPINAGLLTPAEVIQTVLTYKSKVSLASLEGFIAQILGWREFMRAVYLKRPTPPPNRLKHSGRLGQAWYKGTTGLVPVDAAIARVNENAYLHHIERLMVVGNAMFLCEIKPTEVYRWFMELFADSYDWVMVGNVYYMSQWASDAITTKPYISSSAYIKRMSYGYPKGEWERMWDVLYWNTVQRLAPLLRKNYRMAAQVSFWFKKSAEEKQNIMKSANTILKELS